MAWKAYVAANFLPTNEKGKFGDFLQDKPVSNGLSPTFTYGTDEENHEMFCAWVKKELSLAQQGSPNCIPCGHFMFARNDAGDILMNDVRIMPLKGY